MKKIVLFFLVIFINQNMFADDLWIYPKWGMLKTDLERKYKLLNLEIQNLDNHLRYFLGDDISDKFKTYMIDGEKFQYGDRFFNVFVGFYDDKLEWVVITTEQLEKNEVNNKEMMTYYPKLFKVDKLLKKGDAQHNIVSEFCVVSGNIQNNIYYEIQAPLNRDYEQFTFYQMNHLFFRTLALKTNFKRLQFNEHIITRFKPKEKK